MVTEVLLLKRRAPHLDAGNECEELTFEYKGENVTNLLKNVDNNLVLFVSQPK